MNSAPITNSWKLAVVAGSIIGLGLGIWVGRELGSLASFIAPPVGLIVGAISGLDALLPGPGRNSFGRGPRIGPFRAGALYCTSSVASLLFGFYFLGHLSLQCSREATGITCIRSTTGWGDRVETSRQVVEDIRDFVEGNRDQIVTTNSSGERNFIEGFDQQASANLRTMLDGASNSFQAKSKPYQWFPFILWMLAILVAYLSLRSFRYGMKLMGER